MVSTHAYLEFPDKPQPSCINCGFLGHSEIRIVPPHGDRAEIWVMASREQREAGDLPTRLACWRGAAQLDREVVSVGAAASPRSPSANPSDTLRSWVLQVIEKARPDCDRYQPWTRHYSVEQHLEEHKMYLLQKQRREFETSQEVSRRQYESEFSVRWLPLLVAVVAIVTGAAANLCGSYIEAQATLDAARPVATAAPALVPDMSGGLR